MAPVVHGGGVVARVTWVTEVFKVHTRSSAFAQLPLMQPTSPRLPVAGSPAQMMKFGVVDNGLLIIMMMAGVNREYTLWAVASCTSFFFIVQYLFDQTLIIGAGAA